MKINNVEDHLLCNLSFFRPVFFLLIFVISFVIFFFDVSAASASKIESLDVSEEAAYSSMEPISDSVHSSVFQEVADAEDTLADESTKDGAEEIIIGLFLLIGFSVVGIGVATYGMSSR